MKPTIWVLRDTNEPQEGPYWSGHIRELIKAAQKMHCNIIEACIDDVTNPAPTDVLLFRPTQNGVSRRTFIKKVQAIRAFSINKRASFPGTKQSFLKLAKATKIPIPRTWIGSTFHVKRPSSPHGFVVKPSKGGQGKDVVFCQTRKQALREIR